MIGGPRSRPVYVLSMGVFFALLQTGYFFQLQFRLTSAYPSFLAVTLAWLIGSAAGLWLSRNAGTRSVLVWLAASLAAYVLVLLLLRAFPYRMGWLPVVGLLICVSGIHAGVFFGASRHVLGTASRLFFWENNGFILGWIAGFAGYVRSGNTFHWVAPAALALIVAALQPADLTAAPSAPREIPPRAVDPQRAEGLWQDAPEGKSGGSAR